MEYFNIQLSFHLLDTDISPKEISKKIGVIPDVEMLKGERNKKLNIPRCNIWNITSKVQSYEVVDHWIDIEKILLPSSNYIKDLASTGRAEFTILVSFEERPSIIIPPDMSRFAGFINASIDIDDVIP